MSMNSGLIPVENISKKKRFLSGKWIAHLVLSVGGFILFYPLIFSFLCGFFSTYEFVTRKTDTLFPWPKYPTLQNYTIFFTINRAAFNPATAELVKAELAKKGIQSEIQSRIDVVNAGPLLDYMPRILINSVFRTVYMTFFAVLTSLLGGYAFGRLHWKGRDKVFLILLATQMVPGVVSFIPQFVLLHRWPLAGGNNLWGQGGHGLYNTFGVYLFTFCAINIIGTFLVRQSLQRTPIELDEAARVDGASTLRIIFTVLAPLQKPVLAYIAITTAIATWNDWMIPFFFTNDPKLLTLPGGITRLTHLFTAKLDTPNYPLIITLGIALTIPSLMILAFFQRYIVEGVASAGLKG